MKPPSIEEKKLISEISLLPMIIVEIAPREQLKYMRMKPRECHINCHFYADNDPTKQAKSVVGWRYDFNMFAYILHSVVKVGDEWKCITPNETTETSFTFIPDEKIVSKITTEGRIFHYRDDKELDIGLRVDPEKVISISNVIKKRLLSGMDPYKAMQGPL